MREKLLYTMDIWPISSFFCWCVGYQALDHMPTLKPVKQHQINNFRNYGLRGFIMLTNRNRYKHPKPGKFGALAIDQL